MLEPRLRSSAPSQSTADHRRRSTSRWLRSVTLGLLLALAPPTGWVLAASSSSVLGMYPSQDRPGAEQSRSLLGEAGTMGLGNPEPGSEENPQPIPSPSAPVLKQAPATTTDEPDEGEEPVTEPTPDPQPQDPPIEPDQGEQEPQPEPDRGQAPDGGKIQQTPRKDPATQPDQPDQDGPDPAGAG